MQTNKDTHKVKKALLRVAVVTLTILDVWLWFTPSTDQGQAVTVYRDTARPVIVRL